MGRLIQFIVLLVFSVVIGCKEPASTKSPGDMPAAPAAANASAFTLDERLLKADSLVIVFYKDPYGPDSLRYTRYYTQSSVVNGLDIFNGQLKMEYSQQELRKCRTEGKIWCFTQGKVFQTIYFSTKCQECCFTYLIKDGNFYYSTIDPAFVDWLASEKLKGIELPNKAKAENN